MKVLQVNCVYKKGSTGKITYDMHQYLQQQGIDSVVCYGRGEKIKEPNVYKVCSELYSKINNVLSRITGIMYGGCNISTKKVISVIQKEKPDIVHLQCINGYFVNIYKLVNWLKNTNINTVLTLHAEFMYTGGCGHSLECDQWSTHNGCGHSQHCPRYKKETKSFIFDGTHRMWSNMRDAFNGFDKNLIVVSVSPWLKERAERSPIFADKRHEVVFNGLDTNVFHDYGEESKNVLRDELKIRTDKVVFHATPAFNDDINHIKGGYYIIELAKKMQDTTFVIAGSYSDGLIFPSNIKLLGRVADQKKLARLYSMADVTVLTSWKETFSMVTAESLCCGTPTVGFKAGGPEAIALPEYSEFVEHGNVDALQTALQKKLMEKQRVCFADTYVYSQEDMGNTYINFYNDLLSPRG